MIKKIFFIVLVSIFFFLSSNSQAGVSVHISGYGPYTSVYNSFWWNLKYSSNYTRYYYFNPYFIRRVKEPVRYLPAYPNSLIPKLSAQGEAKKLAWLEAQKPKVVPEEPKPTMKPRRIPPEYKLRFPELYQERMNEMRRLIHY